MSGRVDFKNIKYLIVGSGFFGSVIAERLANDMGERVLVIEKKNHIGGMCFSPRDRKTGIEYHKYGTHIFHTDNREVWEYINRFTEFNGYFHQVLTTHNNKVYQMPINLETINSFYGLNLKPFEVKNFLRPKVGKVKKKGPFNFEEKAISLVGEDLYGAFIRGYTKKQWRSDPSVLPESILMRLPFRTNYNESYYSSRWQGVPLMGYTEIFNKMLKHKNIILRLGTDYFTIRRKIPKSVLIIYSGPIDRFFGYRFGRLEWRSLRFTKEVIGVDDYQGTSVMNFADEDIPYTRIHEPKHLHPERKYNRSRTLVIKEFSIPGEGRDPYYPVGDLKNQKLLSLYRQELMKLKNVVIGGRLGDYKYYDMHNVIAGALQTYSSRIKR